MDSFSLIGVANLLWLSGRRNPDDVIGLLELLALVFGIVVVLVSRNYLLEALGLIVALLLVRAIAAADVPGDDLGGLTVSCWGDSSPPDGDAAGARENGMSRLNGVRSTDWRISSPHSCRSDTCGVLMKSSRPWHRRC